MQKIDWMDRVSNDQVLRQINEQRTIIDTIKNKKMSMARPHSQT